VTHKKKTSTAQRCDVLFRSSTDRYLLVLELNNMSKYFRVFLSDHKGNKQIGHLYVFLLLLPENKHVGFPNKLPATIHDMRS